MGDGRQQMGVKGESRGEGRGGGGRKGGVAAHFELRVKCDNV